ncbi:hypothetical protein C0J52_16468 [Blattella germanica]|nr:hypothetical protein C0J52_16468 [Blattella germanica]
MEKESKDENAKQARYYQCYNVLWEKLPIFKGWLAPVPDNKHKAYCKYCKKQFRAHRTDLRTHARSRKHQKAGDEYFCRQDSNENENNTRTVKLSENDMNVSSSDGSPDTSINPVGIQLLTKAAEKLSSEGGISTQVLDLVRDTKGSCSLLKPHEVVEGRYKMHFEVKKYFTLGLHDTFYPYIEVTFEVSDLSELYHVPLLLSPYGYMVYRGT